MSKKRTWLRPKCNDLTISILTNPLPVGLYKISAIFKDTLKSLRNIIRYFFWPLPGYLKSEYSGHPAVTRSVVEGFIKIKVYSNYNPKSLEILSQTVVVLSGISTVKQMIKLKQKGYIKYLIVGPNITSELNKYSYLLASPEIDFYITHVRICPLVGKIIPTLASRCVPWAAGVDCNFWVPDANKIKNHILIYNKQTNGFINDVKFYKIEIEKMGYDCTIINYGLYTPIEYKFLLQKSKLMVAFSVDESQGIAWSEAWSCDVPTFIWGNTEPIYLGVKYDGSTAPYLCDTTGKFFTDTESFIKLLDQWESNVFEFSPRLWCLENQSDEVVAKDLLRILKSI